MMEEGLKPGDLIPRGHGAVLTHDWPLDCAVQGGTNGLVISHRNPVKHYFTAFFEAFPADPHTFVRGEGATVEAAEEAAWAKWQRILACPGHEFEPRGYTNGLGFCKHCNMSQSGTFTAEQLGLKCSVCGIWSFYDSRDGKFFCEDHAPRSPYEDVLP